MFNVDNDPPIAADHWSPPNVASHLPFEVSHIASVAKRAHERDDHCPIVHSIKVQAQAGVCVFCSVRSG